MENRQEQLSAINQLLDIMQDLRSKCPWDGAQTMKTLRTLTIEETYELGDAILEENMEEVKKELGDLLLHVVFYAKIGEEKEAFDLGAVARGICEKLKRRHPHIYGNVTVENAEDVHKNWERIKMREGRESVLEGVPKSLPALVKADRIQDKVSGVGFDWDHIDQVWDKVQEELAELKVEIQAKNQEKIEEEFGDFLFSLVNYGRYLNINPENALERTNKKFIKRFQYLERQAKKVKKKIEDMTLSEMNTFWEEAKQLERKNS